ncbi:MAG: AAA family ATPase [Alphaproteobacteria bacterium]|nr:AAA family ATPase [Alphaproteobacteria bacterium]
MAWKSKSTTDSEVDTHKCLFVGHHGWGKTTQAIHLQKAYGPGLIISGEGGLRSVMTEEIDYVDFTSWDGEHKPDEGKYSFRGICRDMASADFQKANYKWIMIDSLTELADQCMAHVSEVHKDNKNGYEKWGDYARMMLGAVKWVRDLPFHVVVTSLAKEENDDNGQTHYWPMLQGKGVMKQLPGIFDHVFCGIRVTSGDRENPMVTRYVVTDEVRGWHGKARDPRHRLKPVEKTGNITDLFRAMSMSDEEFKKQQTKIQPTRTEDNE